MAKYYPDVVKALCSLCIHYIRPGELYFNLDAMVEFVPALEYQVIYYLKTLNI
jgi:soluble epoxide hydrolase/lipid-phosphate phosphatase